MSRVIANIDESRVQYGAGGADRLEYSMQFIGRELPQPTIDQRLSREALAEGHESPSPMDETPAAAVDSALTGGSTVGYLFHDRTRISPAGLALGEHVYSLSLAPGEEVILEQKTWTTRQVSLEELTEDERTVDLEQSSTFSTEMDIDLSRETETRRTFSMANAFDSTAGATIPIEGVSIALNVTNSQRMEQSLADADTTTRTDSVTRTHERTSKVAAKQRSLHKTTFRIATETGFQATSRRTVRNPNRGSALTLHYFKVLRALAISRERVGVQLCWAPFVTDPGFGVRERIRKAREAAAAGSNAEVILPPRPQPPVPTGEPQWHGSGRINLDKYFGPTRDMSVDVEATIAIPSGYQWDGVNASVTLIFEDTRSHESYIKGQPWAAGPHLKAIVHTGISWTLLPGAPVHAEVEFFANFVPVDAFDPAAVKAYQEALAAWEAEVARIRAEAGRRAGEQALNDVDRTLNALSPVAELIPAVVRSYFSADVRDEFREVELWHRIFDFGNGGYALLPGTWADGELHFPERGAADFLNASWARLFLPIRPGYELAALRFIYGGTPLQPLDPVLEDQIAQLQAELAAYRTEHFGSPSGESGVDPATKALTEKYDTIARWTETLPTDGTHIEAILSQTTGLDVQSEQVIADEKALRDSIVKDQVSDERLKTKALEHFGKGASTTIHVSTDGQ
jgi:hypothetical protein